MRTWSGENAPLKEGMSASLLDMVVHLGREGRYGGWGDRGQSWKVLHHTMLGALIWMKLGYDEEGLPFWITHDGHEYILGDMPKPVKEHLHAICTAGGYKGEPPMRVLEGRVDKNIRKTLDIGMPTHKMLGLIKHVDLLCLVIEGKMFGPPNCDNFADDVPRKKAARVLDELKLCFPEVDWSKEDQHVKQNYLR